VAHTTRVSHSNLEDTNQAICARFSEASPEEHAALGSHNACNELALDQLHLEKKLELRFRNAAANL
jgi:hypothetical protein